MPKELRKRRAPETKSSRRDPLELLPETLRLLGRVSPEASVDGAGLSNDTTRSQPQQSYSYISLVQAVSSVQSITDLEPSTEDRQYNYQHLVTVVDGEGITQVSRWISDDREFADFFQEEVGPRAEESKRFAVCCSNGRPVIIAADNREVIASRPQGFLCDSCYSKPSAVSGQASEVSGQRSLQIDPPASGDTRDETTGPA